jgi:hypothetical protein
MSWAAHVVQGITLSFVQRHGNRVKRLGRAADARKALLRSLTTEVIRHGRIKTTLIKAKVGFTSIGSFDGATLTT